MVNFSVNSLAKLKAKHSSASLVMNENKNMSQPSFNPANNAKDVLICAEPKNSSPVVTINKVDCDSKTPSIDSVPKFVATIDDSNNIFLQKPQINIPAESLKSESPVDELKNSLNKTKSEQGFIGKAWDAIKNLLKIGASSDKAEKAIEDFAKGEISYEEAKKKLEAYKDGQKDCVELAGDIAGGIAVGVTTLCTGGIGSIVAGGIYAGAKSAIKFTDAKVAGRKYDIKDFAWDTGSGFLSSAAGVVGGQITSKLVGRVATKVPVFNQMATWLSEDVVKTGTSGAKKIVKRVLGLKGTITAQSVAKATVGNLASDSFKGVCMGTWRTARGVIKDGKDFSLKDYAKNVKNETIKYAGFQRVFSNVASSSLSDLNLDEKLSSENLAEGIKQSVVDFSKRGLSGQAKREVERIDKA